MDSNNTEVLKKAIEMEEEGKQFYLQSAQKAKSLLARKIFQELADEEELHKEKIEELFEDLRQGKSLNKWVTKVADSSKLEKVFQDSLMEKATASSDDLDALRFALDLENKSVKYYENLNEATSDPRQRRFYLTLSQEERGHYLKLLDSIEYLTDPEDWFQVKEKPGLDGA